jgi:hypothetical protein
MVMMGGSLERRQSWLRSLTLTFFLIGLFLATAWDADGNANTDNLPQTTFSIERRSVRSTADASHGDESTDSPTEVPRPLRRPRPIQHFLREWCWRILAIPSRGP